MFSITTDGSSNLPRVIRKSEEVSMRISVGILAFAVLIFVLHSTGCNLLKAPPVKSVAPAGTKYLTCADTINVTATGVANEHQAVYVCDDTNYNTVTWTRLTGVNTFKVSFQGTCPFESCSPIDETHASSTVKYPLPDHLQVYKYSITINTTVTQDPHVVGGGGH
jgi:hypothetical protein